MCASCHRLYDQKPEWIKKANLKRIGKKLSEEHKLKISKISKGKINLKNKNSAVKVNQYNLNNNLIKSWDSITDASTYLKINASGITLCCRNHIKKSGGFIWKYLNNV